MQFVEKVPFRSPEGPLNNLRHLFAGKNVCDLGCGSGDAMLYIRDALHAKSVCGIDNTNRSACNVEAHNLSVTHGDILDVRFEDIGAETFYMWIEAPAVEIEVLRRLKKTQKPCVAVIAYNTQGKCSQLPNDTDLPYNANCDNVICRYLGVIPSKVARLLDELRDEYKFVTEELPYNNGSGCREAGVVTYFIISFGQPCD